MEASLLSKLQFWRKLAPTSQLGLYVCADKIFVYQAATEESVANFSTFNFKKLDWVDAFEQIVKTLGIAKIQIVLSAEFYQVIQVDKPNVEADEMTAALLWSVKDLVSQAVTDIHLDYFESSKQTTNKVSVVVAEKKQLTSILLAARAAGMETCGVTIEEMAITHLFSDSQARLLLSHRAGGELLLAVVKDGELFMQRRVRGFLQLDSVAAEDLAFGLADNLSLEIQRSMDFFESQLREAPVVSIDLLMLGARDKLAALVSENFNQSVTPYQAESVEAVFSQMALAEFSQGDSI
ncbi:MULTISPECIES: MSHA biogenesis protein MshI [unclassified Shewanella]|uniref:MSHA biogenesis protein MshI n=1 Tax=unclassified Shewanella TaxID=196818 RepID=UPI000C7D9908|nr:MSHA biogenesis protein MshI [Shewanella sp. GutDb-MelDb]PKG74953.1 MSHA biogenesis protein MshI [Shewanella sp. GutCb]